MIDRHFLIQTVVIVLAATACGSPLSPSSESAAATITITATGVVPRDVRIDNWNHIRFVNNDIVPHEIVSDPVNAHSDCPLVNAVGYLPPGASGEKRTRDDAFRGRIVVVD